MKNINFTKTLTAGVALALAIYPQAWATEYIACGNKNGDTNSNCWSCGETCSARFDSSTGALTYSGTGDMYSNITMPDSWNKNTRNQIYSVVIEEGITSVANALHSCWNLGDCNLTSISLPSTLTKIGTGSFMRMEYTGLNGLVIPENVTEWEGNSALWRTRGTVYCPKSQINNCRANNDSSEIFTTFSSYEKIDGLYYIYDNNGKVDEIYSSYGDFDSSVKKPVAERLSQKDEDGNITVYDSHGDIAAKYSAEGVLSRYIKNADGSTSIYTNGKLTGLKNAKSITPAQAAALVKKGNHNTVTLTFK